MRPRPWCLFSNVQNLPFWSSPAPQRSGELMCLLHGQRTGRTQRQDMSSTLLSHSGLYQLFTSRYSSISLMSLRLQFFSFIYSFNKWSPSALPWAKCQPDSREQPVSPCASLRSKPEYLGAFGDLDHSVSTGLQASWD